MKLGRQFTGRYLRGIVFDRTSKVLRFEILEDPEEGNGVSEVLVFEGVEDRRQVWLEKDDDCIEMLIGIDNGKTDDSFVVATDQREIVVTARSVKAIEGRV